VKWKNIAEPLWQPESNLTLKPYFEQYYDMMNCTFDYFPTVLSKKHIPCCIELENNELAISIKGKKVTDYKTLTIQEKHVLLDRLEALCYENSKIIEK
jgi:hypothetical protein